MHYIRCLRAPKVTLSGKTPLLEITLTVTTDLGDTFLFPPDDPIPLLVTVYVESDGAATAAAKRAWPLSGKDQLFWKAGQRVAKPTLRLPSEAATALAGGREVEMCVSAASRYAADGVEDILRSGGGDEDGRIMSVWTTLGSWATGDDVDVCFRKLHLSDASEGLPGALSLSEEIGESIARHIWDGGLVAACALYGTFAFPDLEASQGACVQAVRNILSSDKSLNILEVGCGVGILGLGIASLRALLHRDTHADSAMYECLLLMTDVEEAETRALSNMAQLSGLPHQRAVYENLDWHDGRRGRFGPMAASRHWDLVVLSDCTYNVDMLPALVETLSALHAHKGASAGDGSDRPATPTTVFLATKPRHASERALFDLMAENGWAKSKEQVVPLPVIGSEPESVELYLFEKR